MAITYTSSDNKITVTGYSEETPCNFTDLYNADKAGTLDLFSGTPAENITLTNQVRPSDELALKIDFILSDSDAGTGDTIVITGTDKDDNAQSETLTTEADGTFTTTKWYKTVTDVDCIGFTAGTLTIRQNQWGVIWKTGTSQFTFNCKIDIGDGTETWFADENKQIVFLDGIVTDAAQSVIDTKDNGHFRLGRLYDEYNKYYGNGCAFFILESNYYTRNFDTSAGDNNFYDTKFYASTASGRAYLGYVNNIYGCIFTGYFNFDIRNQTDAYNIVYNKTYGGIRLRGSGQVSNIFSINCDSIAIIQNGTLSNVYARGLSELEIYLSSGIACLINFDIDSWVFDWKTTGGTINRQYTFNLKVIDKDNNPIENATVILKDKDGNMADQKGFSTTTNGDGEITEQTVTYGYYNYENGDTMQSYSPHTLEIGKAGYKSYETKLILNEKIDWKITLRRISVCVDEEVIN
ncbi:MAG: carboxypeptidase-like regulatory domain-containing protein [Candidatus Syntrophoarchaeum sp.]|nr:carboxypeptidase-like regulatory domain-containing protein [Candidatus Syntrophoarchaeum sp.]